MMANTQSHTRAARRYAGAFVLYLLIAWLIWWWLEAWWAVVPGAVAFFYGASAVAHKRAACDEATLVHQTRDP